MKKYNRQRLILDLIEEKSIQTQEELAELLSQHGIKATQATISRDIKELRITKVQNMKGEYRYTVLDTVHDSLNERLQKITRSSILSISHNDSTVIIQTVIFCASVVAMTITNAQIANVAGIVSGQDTIFISPKSPKDLDQIVTDIEELIG